MDDEAAFLSRVREILAQYPFEVLDVRINHEEIIEVVYKTYLRADSVRKLIPKHDKTEERAPHVVQQIVILIENTLCDTITLRGRNITVSLDGPIYAECQSCQARCEYPAEMLANAARTQSIYPIETVGRTDRQVLYNMLRSLSGRQRSAMRLALVGGVIEQCTDHCYDGQPKALSD